MDADEQRATEIIRSWPKPPYFRYGSIEGMGECSCDQGVPSGNFYVIDYDATGLIAIKWDNLSYDERVAHANFVRWSFENWKDDDD
jgi:hypothetical protein